MVTHNQTSVVDMISAEEQRKDGVGATVRIASQSRLTSSPAIVAGWNFGCGSSREHAVTCLMGLGIQLVVAKSFSRIFFRNAVNNGLAVVVCDLADRIQDDELISVNVAKGKADLAGGSFQFTPLAPPLLNILQHGGLWKTPRPSAGGQ
jgi:3-isopropylmalate/(R)-2-methylmalate dehydratase small subunit